jgi:CMP-N-acetylneuraminic acid synthetase
MVPSKQARVLGVIPARGNSKRFPRKNIALLDGEPLVVRAARTALRSTLDEVIVSTEDNEIFGIASAVAPTIRRPGTLSMDSVTTQEVLTNIVAHGTGFDFIMCLQPDVPFRTVEDIDVAIQMVIEKNADFLGTYMEINQPVIRMSESSGRLLSRDFLGRADTFKPCGVLEIYKTSALLAGEGYERAYGFIPPRRSYSVDIDEPFDLQVAQAILDAERIKDAVNSDWYSSYSNAAGPDDYQSRAFHNTVSA